MPPIPIPAWTTGVIRDVLPNGLTLLVQRDSSAPVAAVVTYVKAGFFDEPDRWVGISHVFEHMFFKGTPTHGVGEIARATKAAGGYLNASTTYDRTSYYAVAPAEKLPEILAVQADALMHALVDPDELARELQVIIQEAKRKRDNPAALTHETLHEVMYDRHRIRRWRIGHEADLAGFTRDDVYGYYHSRYVPGRTIVAIVGDVDPAATLALARRTYESWEPRPGAVDRSPVEPALREVRARTLRGDVTQAELAFGWRGVASLHPDAIALDLAAGVLGSGRGSWLYRALRESGLATGVSAHHYSPTELGVFSIGVTCEPERVAPVMERVAEETARLALSGPPPADLERARTLLLTRWARGMEEMDGRAASLASAEALEGYQLLDREFAQLASVTGDQVREAAARYLDPEAVAAVVYLPQERGVELTAGDLGSVFAVTQLAGPAAPPAEQPRSRGAAPAVGAGTPATIAQVHHLPLPGCDLLVRRKPGVPAVSLGIYLPRATFDPPGQAGLSALSLRAMLRGADGLDAAGLAFAIERLGGTLSPSVGLDWLGLGTSVLAPNLGAAAELLCRVLTRPAYPEIGLLAERGLLVEETTRVADDMFRYPFQLAFAGAFGEQGYGVPALGLPEEIGGLEADAVRRWHGQVLQRSRAVVVAVGDLDPERELPRLSGIFAELGRREPVALDREVSWQPDGADVVRSVSRRKAQSALALAFRGPARRDPSRFAADVWSAIASGLGGRLFEALRDRRSLAYTVLASSWQKARGGAFITYIATSPEREEEARREMLNELTRFAAERVTADELQRATSYLAGQVQVGRQSAAALAGEILEAWIAGTGLEELDDPAARFRAVTADDIREVAAAALASAHAEGLVRGG